MQYFYKSESLFIIGQQTGPYAGASLHIGKGGDYIAAVSFYLIQIAHIFYNFSAAAKKDLMANRFRGVGRDCLAAHKTSTLFYQIFSGFGDQMGVVGNIFLRVAFPDQIVVGVKQNGFPGLDFAGVR